MTDLTIPEFYALSTAKERKGVTRRALLRRGLTFYESCEMIRTLCARGLLESTGQRRKGSLIFALSPQGEVAIQPKRA